MASITTELIETGAKRDGRIRSACGYTYLIRARTSRRITGKVKHPNLPLRDLHRLTVQAPVTSVPEPRFPVILVGLSWPYGLSLLDGLSGYCPVWRVLKSFHVSSTSERLFSILPMKKAFQRKQMKTMVDSKEPATL